MPSRLSHLSPRACVAAGAIRAFLRPVLAFDARGFDPAPLLTDITSRNYKAKVPEIVERVKTATARMIARDAAPDPRDLQALLEALGNQGEDESNPANFTSTRPDDRAHPTNSLNVGLPSTRDRTMEAFDDEDHSVLTFLEGKLNPADMQKAKTLVAAIQDNADDTQSEHDIQALLDFLQGKISDADLEKAAELVLAGPGEGTPGEDSPPGFRGMPRPGGKMARDARRLAFDAAFAARYPNLVRRGRVLTAGEPIPERRVAAQSSPAAEKYLAEFRAKFGQTRVL